MTITLADGTALEGRSPVVVIGPNGSGKSRKIREIGHAVPIDFINALRSTRVAPQIPVMGMDDARNNYNSQRQQAHSAHWELATDFDYMLSQLLAQDARAAVDFRGAFLANPANPGAPSDTAMLKVQEIWRSVFPGRELSWPDWKPLVKNKTAGSEAEYSGNSMSDGEKAALYLCGKVLTVDAGILVVDEPETHLHTMLAVALWNSLEQARPDVRFVYVTHDLSFALSRGDARYVIANPVGGLKAVDVDAELPKDVAEAILGAASLSFYASRVVFTEGEPGGLDDSLYGAWFNGQDTVVRPVGSCQSVLRCCEALNKSGISQGLEVLGLIDGDFHPDAFHDSQPDYVHSLKVHEVESLFCLPEVVKALAGHLGKTDWDEDAYRAKLAASVTDSQRHAIIIDRWKSRIEPNLLGVVAGAGKSRESLDALAKRMPELFDYTKWSFSPQVILEEEKKSVEAILPSGSSVEILRVAPGKPLIAVAASTLGMKVRDLADLTVKALAASGKGDDKLSPLGTEIANALNTWLPARRTG